MKVNVVPWAARYRRAAPLGFALAALLMFLLGLAMKDVRRDPVLRPFLWGSLAVAIGLAAVAIVQRLVLAARVVVDDRGVSVIGREAMQLGRPERVQHGCYDQLVVLGRGALRRRNVTYLWIAVEGERGGSIVLQRGTGIQTTIPQWPRARPPRDATMYDVGTADMPALRAAIGRLIT